MIALSRKTTWEEPQEGFYTGLGQRVFTTDAGDVSLMDVRSVVWNHASADQPAPSGAADAAGL